MHRSLGLTLVALMILEPASRPAAEELPYTELEAPRFEGGTLDNWVLPSLNTRFSAFKFDGTLVAATCGSQVFVWKVPTGELLWRTTLPLRENPSMVRGKVASVALHGHQVSFSPGGRWLAVSSFHPANIYFWKVATIISESDDEDPIVLSSTEIVEATPRAWNAAVSVPNLCWQSDDDAVVYATGNLYSLQLTDSLRLHPYVNVKPNHWMDIAIDPENDSGLSMIGVNVTPYRNGSLLTVFHNREAIPQVNALGFAQFTPLAYVTASRDWSQFAGISRDLKSLGIFDSRSGRTRVLEESPVQWSTHMAWSHDGRVLATGRNSDFREPFRRAERFATSPKKSSEELLATRYTSSAPTLIFWETTSARQLSSIAAGKLAPGNGSSCDVGAFSPDSRFLLTHVPRPGLPGRPGYFQLWDTSTVLQKLRGPQ